MYSKIDQMYPWIGLMLYVCVCTWVRTYVRMCVCSNARIIVYSMSKPLSIIKVKFIRFIHDWFIKFRWRFFLVCLCVWERKSNILLLRHVCVSPCVYVGSFFIRHLREQRAQKSIVNFIIDNIIVYLFMCYLGIQ